MFTRCIIGGVLSACAGILPAATLDLATLPQAATTQDQVYTIDVGGTSLTVTMSPVLSDLSTFVQWRNDDGHVGIERSDGWGKYIDSNGNDAMVEGVSFSFSVGGSPVSIDLGASGVAIDMYREGEYDIVDQPDWQNKRDANALPTVTGLDSIVIMADDDGSSSSRDAFRVTSLDIAAVDGGSTPTDINLQALAVSHESVQLSWDDQGLGTGDEYQVLQKDVTGGETAFSLIYTAGPSETNYTVSGLAASNVYEFQVDAVDNP